MDTLTLPGLPPTSLTICSRNRPKLLIETVYSVLQGDEIPAELVIVDQSDSSHQTLGTLTTDRPCQIRYLWMPSKGVGQARNAAIAAAQHQILVLTDDDMFVTPAWFGKLVRALIDAGEHSVVTGKVLPAEAEVPGGFAPSTIVDEAPAVHEGRIGKDVLFTGNMAMFRTTFDEVGKFDERLGAGARFPAAYDNDFGFRLLEAGFRIIYVPEAAVYHRAWRSKNNYFRLRWNYGRGQGAYYAKHLSLRDRYMLRRLIEDIRIHVLGFLRRVWRQPRLASGDAMKVLGLLSGATEMLVQQRRGR